MNKDIRINWSMGMELLPETFIHLENQLAKYRMMLRKVQASKQFGLIPDMPFEVSLSINGDLLTLNRLECHALLQHGGMVDLDLNESKELSLTGCADSCYVAVYPTEEKREYEVDEVPLIENLCQIGLRNLDELPGTMPVAKVTRQDGMWHLQDDYIVPLVSMESFDVMTNMAAAMVQLVRQIITHEKFNHLRSRDVIRMMVEEMECLDPGQSPKDFAVLCRQLARLLDYTVFEEPMLLPTYNPYDIQLFLNDLCTFFIKVHEVLPTIEVVEYQPVVKEQEPEAPVEEEIDFPIL